MKLGTGNWKKEMHGKWSLKPLDTRVQDRCYTGNSNIPGALVVEETIRSLFILFCDGLWLFVSLEPRLILLVETPTLRLECLGCQVLLISTLSVVEDEKQRVWVEAGVQCRVVEERCWILGIISWRCALVGRLVMPWLLGVVYIRACSM